MSKPREPREPAGDPDVQRELDRLLGEARRHFAARNPRRTAEALCAAHALAHHHGLHRQAVVFRQAIVILAGGGRPKLLTRPGLSEPGGL